MKKFVTCGLLLCFVISAFGQTEFPRWTPYDDSSEIEENAMHETRRMRYKLVQSKVWDKNNTFDVLREEVSKLSAERYNEIRPFVLEQTIPSIQAAISNGVLSYEELVLFYLYRIYTYEIPNETTLNTVLALNPKVVAQARALDVEVSNGIQPKHLISGMPILLKDNINTENMPTTAGAIALQENSTDDAFIVSQLKKNGALILGKVNLSEWAYFICSGCPVGYSAVGGQTLNPYGRRLFETGGSSAGSGTSVAANYAVAAVGTETSGSILSPSSQNNVVGLKPTVGTLSRVGIVPISSTLDTPGPMTKSVIDAAILYNAMLGFDENDSAAVRVNQGMETIKEVSLKGKRFGVFKDLLDNENYKAAVALMKKNGAVIIPFDPPKVSMDGFLHILNMDMKVDLPSYLKTQPKSNLPIASVAEAVAFNKQDSVTRIPYGQALFLGIENDTTSAAELAKIKATLKLNGRTYFDSALKKHQLDAILSINNYHAGYAAVAAYPALTVPMGFKKNNEPISLTFIAPSFQELALFKLGAAYEEVSKLRAIPEAYKE